MSNTVLLDNLMSLFKSTDEVLNEWTGDGNLQFPVLLTMMAVKLNWNEKQIREADPLIRYYIRNSPDWYVTRGAHGGIMKASEKQKKEAVLAAKEAAKASMKAAIEAKALAAKTAVVQAVPVNVVESDESDESEDEVVVNDEDQPDSESFQLK